MDIDALLKRLIRFNEWYNKLSPNEKSIYNNNPDAIPSGDTEAPKSKILKILKDYSTAERTNEGKDYIQNNETRVRNVLMETQSNLQNLFPSVYDTQFDPILSNTFLSGIVGTASTDAPAPPAAETKESETQKDETIVEPEDGLPSDDAVAAAGESKEPTPEEAGKVPLPAPEETAPEETAPAETQATTSEDPAEDRLLKVFDKYMVGEYNPNSAMDRGKMEVLKKALEKFYQENGKRFEIENADDKQKFQTIINQAYASPEYKNAATIGRSIPKSDGSQSPTSTTSTTPTETQSNYTVPVSVKYGKDTLPTYVDMGGKKYRPATQKDIADSKTQLYIRNPRKGKGEFNKPEYVPLRREGADFRAQSKMGGVAGSVSNFAGDVGNTVKNFFSGGRKKEETDDEGSPTADRPPAKKQSKDGEVYQRNPESVDSFFK